MKSMIIGGFILVLALMSGTYIVVGDAFNLGDDYINDLTMLAAIAIIGITVFVALKYINQIKNDVPSGELMDENWDGIGEYKNKIPTGWAVMFIGTIGWMAWYMHFGYPTNQFSQIGQYNEEVLEHQKKFETTWKNISKSELPAMGESIFLVQCAPCHGIDAEGISGKSADLTKRITEESVLNVIKHGGNNFKTFYPGGMPAGMAQGNDAKIISKYVVNNFKGTAPEAYSVCASCHGINGEGIMSVGPNIRIFDDSLIKSVLIDGKKSIIGEMPSFKGRLSETQMKAIGSYLRNLGE